VTGPTVPGMPAVGAPELGAPELGAPELGAPEVDGAAEAEPQGAGSSDRAGDTGHASVVHPRVWQRRVGVLRDQARRRLRWVVGGVAVLVAVCVALLTLHTPLLALRHATVVGAPHTGAQAVLQAAGLEGDPPLIDVDPKSVAARVESLPWVAHAVVVRHWPDSVTILVTERVPLGSVARPGGGVALVDASGRVLAWQATTAGLVLVAPVTPGRPGTVLPAAARPALAVASALPTTLAGRVQRVTANSLGMVTLGLGKGVSAALGSTQDLAAKLVAVASVLAGVHVRGPAVIDVTVPDEPTVGPPSPAS
jgi:cell division protein FtsQ